MSKILVSVNESGFLNAISDIKAITDNVERLNNIIEEYLGQPLSQEIFNDVTSMKGLQTKELCRQTIQSDITRLKISSPTTKRNMLAGADEFEDLINKFSELLRKESRYVEYITIENGKGKLTDEAKNRLHETFKNYAATPEQIEVYEAQKEACTALNNLYTLVRATSDIRFILPIHFYSSFFDMEDNIINPKPVQFSVFNKNKYNDK